MIQRQFVYFSAQCIWAYFGCGAKHDEATCKQRFDDCVSGNSCKYFSYLQKVPASKSTFFQFQLITKYAKMWITILMLTWCHIQKTAPNSILVKILDGKVVTLLI